MSTSKNNRASVRQNWVRFRLPPWLGLALLFGTVSCRPEAPDAKSLPRVEVPFTGITDGKNATATPVPEPAEPEDPEDEVVTDLPDPKAKLYSRFFEYQLQFSEGDVSVLSVREFRTQHPTAAARKMGRFAFELYVGHHLLERVRFDFPLLGASEPAEDDPIEAGLTTQIMVTVPHAERATIARILDRKTREIVELPWPPQSSPAASEPGTVAPGSRPSETGR